MAGQPFARNKHPITLTGSSLQGAIIRREKFERDCLTLHIPTGSTLHEAKQPWEGERDKYGSSQSTQELRHLSLIISYKKQRQNHVDDQLYSSCQHRQSSEKNFQNFRSLQKKTHVFHSCHFAVFEQTKWHMHDGLEKTQTIFNATGRRGMLNTL